jgi:predicted nucleotidyltransferase component of viral defense system
VIWEKKLAQLHKILIKILETDFLPQNSYLAGGTALYFYLNHRVSVDIDFFSSEQFRPDALLYEARERFGQVDVEILEKDSLILFLSREKIKFSLFHLPYPLLSDLNSHHLKTDLDCPMASLEDIEAMKAIAIAQRGSAKDFVDLFYLLKRTQHSFDELFSCVQRKYQVDEKYSYHLKTAMVYFFDADQEIDDIFIVDDSGDIRKITPESWGEIKRFFTGFCR